MRHVTYAIAFAALGLAAAADAGPLRDRLAARLAQRADADAPAAPAKTALTYGTDPLQQIDLYRPAGPGAHPLIVFVHGGGWKRGSKDSAASRYAPAHYTGEGYAYAAIDYRLVPGATIEQQAADVAAALAALLRRADDLGIDRRRVVLMGHSAGAHLAALVGTDERYLKGAGLSFRDLSGIVPIDGAAYDVPSQMKQAGRLMSGTYTQAFGTDPARQAALSPTRQAAAPNAPAFLLLHVQRQDGIAQAKELEAALRAAGTAVERRDFPGTGLQGHAEINRRLGDPTYAATGVVDAWLKARFGG